MLRQIDEELMDSLKKVSTDEEMFKLGFKFKGLLCERKGYENFHERLSVWAKEIEDSNDVYIAVTVDQGNGCCSVAYTDMYIEDICSPTLFEVYSVDYETPGSSNYDEIVVLKGGESIEEIISIRTSSNNNQVNIRNARGISPDKIRVSDLTLADAIKVFGK